MSGGTCRSCGAPIVWGITKNGRLVPMDPPENRYVFKNEDAREDERGRGRGHYEIEKTWLSHFATCPDRDQHRRKS